MQAEKISWVVLIILLGVGVFTLTPPVTFLTLSLMAALLAGGLWAQSGFEHLKVDHSIRPDRSMVGDEIDLQVQVDNPTILPLPWVEINSEVPIDSLNVRGNEGPRGLLQVRTGLSWFQRLRRTYRVTCLKRGYYQIGPASVRVWDPLGLTFEHENSPDRASLVVYPLTVPLDELNLATDHPLGDPQQQRWLFLDPMSVAGARPHRPEDPLRWIHWPATAAQGELMTRNLEGTRSPELLIFVNLQTLPHAWQGTVNELVELSITTAASVAQWAAKSGYRVGLYSNGNMAKESQEDAAPLMKVPPSEHPSQLGRILDALARCTGYRREPLSETMIRQLSGTVSPTTCVVISAISDPDLHSAMLQLQKNGHRITFMYTGDPPAPEMKEISSRTIGGRRRWEQIVRQHIQDAN